jgi:hypothetical protein
MFGVGGFVALLSVLMTLGFGAYLVSRGVIIVRASKKHNPFGTLDASLPLRGRWLGYAAAFLLVLTGTVVMLAGAVALISMVLFVVGLLSWGA